MQGLKNMMGGGRANKKKTAGGSSSSSSASSSDLEGAPVQKRGLARLATALQAAVT
jgi:hypothetical protein